MKNNYPIHPRNIIDIRMKNIEAKTLFFEQLEDIITNYDIKDNIFGYHQGKCEEIKEGYYNEEKSFENFEEIKEEFDVNKHLIRINKDKKFLGVWYGSTKNINEGLTVDLSKKIII